MRRGERELAGPAHNGGVTGSSSLFVIAVPFAQKRRYYRFDYAAKSGDRHESPDKIMPPYLIEDFSELVVGRQKNRFETVPASDIADQAVRQQIQVPRRIEVIP